MIGSHSNLLLALVASSCFLSACGAHRDSPVDAVPAPDAEAGSTRPLVDSDAPSGYPAGPLADAAPADNPLTEPRAQLGKRLFFDRRLSRTREIACANCHQQDHAFSDPAPVSTGVDGLRGSRNAPALVNLAWSESFFWDGRAKTLEQQAGMPIENPVEMDLKLSEAVVRLNEDPAYTLSFLDAFGEGPSEGTLRKALASFIRTLVSGTSRYDRYLAGRLDALEAAEKRGEEIFFGERGGCFHCHPPGALSNDGFFNDGSFVEGGDRGRAELTGRTGDLGKFKVPTLRNVAESAPYMHDGSLQTLEDVVAQYDQGGRGHPSTDPQIAPLGLSPTERADLVSFLRALSDEMFLTDPRFRP